MKSPRQTKLDALLRQIAHGGITDKQILKLLADNDLQLAPDNEPDVKQGHTRVHKIGKVDLTYHVVRKQKFYELEIDGKFIGQSRWAGELLAKAREQFPKPERNETVHQEIIAYRGWHLIGDVLVPLTRANDLESWEGPVAHVRDIDTSDRGGNGLWAIRLTDRTAINEMLTSYRPMAHGLVALSGKVVEYERGYRAQRQMVRLIRVAPAVSDEFLKLIGDRYQCQVFRAKTDWKPGWQ